MTIKIKLVSDHEMMAWEGLHKFKKMSPSELHDAVIVGEHCFLVQIARY